MSPNSIRNCWKKGGFHEAESESESEDNESEISFKWPFDQATVDKWMQMDHDETSPPTTDEAIVKEIQDESDEDANEDSQLSEAQQVSKEAREAISKLN